MKKHQKSKSSRFEYAPLVFKGTFPIRADLHWKYVEKARYTPPHLHNCLEIGVCHSGSGVFLIADKVRSYKAGSCVIINDREPHCVISRHSTKSEWSWLYIDAAGMLSGFISGNPHALAVADIAPLCGSGFENIISPKTDPYACGLIERMISELDERGTFFQDVVRHSLFLLLVKLHRQYSRFGFNVKAQKPRAHSGSYHGDLERLEPALRYISGHFSEQLSIGNLAKLCFMGEGNFRKIFNDLFGVNPKRYITNYRIAHAGMELKSSSRSVDAVALRNGFQDTSSFSREFKKQLGKTPREWRKQD
jgi:AraC family transcriptional regulator, activator of mtrCDE